MQRSTASRAEQKKDSVGHLWLEFDETLLEVKGADDVVRLHDTFDADYFFNSSSLAGGSTENRMIAAVPGFTAAELDKLSWQQFEALCVELLAKITDSESTWLTNSGADHGADGVLLSNRGNILVQAKFTQRQYDGYKGIQEIHSAKPIYESAMKNSFERLIFVTNSPSLAKRTHEIAVTCGVEVLGRTQLLAYLEEYEITLKDILSRLGKDRLRV